MHAKIFSLRRCAGLICAGAILTLPRVSSAASDIPTQADAFPNFESYVKLSGQAPFITGDSAAFATRTGTPNTGAGGIEDLFITKDLSKDTTVTINGHALAGTDDFLGSVNFTKNDFGSFEVGYKSFRTYYDGVGGFFPQSSQFQVFTPEQLHTDRAAFWITATLALPDRPVFKISYREELRTGQKDSSEWAAIVNPLAVVVNGAIVGTALPANTPFTAPNVLTIDEDHHILEGSMVATFGKITETFKVTGDWANNLDHRSYVKYPGSTVLADPTVTVLDDQEDYKSNSYKLLSQTEAKFNDYLAVELGLTYQHLDTTFGGEWDTPTYSTTLKTVYTAITAGNIYGGSMVDDYVGNIFLKLTPNKNWAVDLGFRDECNITGSSGGFTNATLPTTAKNTLPGSFTVASDVCYSHYVDHVATPEVTVQYTGFDRVSLYATYNNRVNHGGQHWINPYAAATYTGTTGVSTTATVPLGSTFFQEANQNNQDAKFGANWNMSNQLTIRAEVFRKDHDNRFIGANDIVGTASYGALYATGYTFTGAKLSVIYKLTPELSFNSRYQAQNGMMSVTANAVTGGVGNEATSGKAKTQSFSETIDWTPNPQVYVQGNVNVVFSYIQTAYPAVVVSTTSNIATPIQNFNNNYYTGSALCGFVLNKQTDVQLQGFWMKADNYNPEIATGGQPYGASFEQASVTAGVKCKFSDRLIGEAKVGYLRRIDDTTGGNTNFHGPLGYLSLTFAL
ncbi:MAG: hypothetical protein ACHQ4G_12000 [Opitutales bacterium]